MAEFDEKATEMLPCMDPEPVTGCRYSEQDPHITYCPASYRDAIAQALRDAKTQGFAEGTEAAIAWLENNWRNAELRMLDPINAMRGMRHALIPTPAEKEYKSPDCNIPHHCERRNMNLKDCTHICGVEDEFDTTY